MGAGDQSFRSETQSFGPTIKEEEEDFFLLKKKKKTVDEVSKFRCARATVVHWQTHEGKGE